MKTGDHKKSKKKKIEGRQCRSTDWLGEGTEVDKHSLSWNWVIPIQNALIYRSFSPPLHADSAQHGRLDIIAHC